MSNSDFGHDQGGVQSSTSTEFDAIESGTPKSGVSEAPKTTLAEFGPGAGIGSTGRKIH